MLKKLIHIIIVLCLLWAPCVHALEMHGSASVSDVMVIALEKTGDCADDKVDITHSTHKCCGDHSSYIFFEKIHFSGSIFSTATFIFKDTSKSSAIVEPALEPPTA
ncbi:MAG: hypothetical protein SFW65_09340 [Alphaproteobacteria bacterium]|nr:hypothetical protein [Alphaproteobacteria bacterium]